TWYHVFAIINSGSYDVYFDTSPTAAKAPAGTTAHRYIGSFLTDASAYILKFTQVGNRFEWWILRQDLTSGTATTPTLITVSTPLGFSVTGEFVTFVTPNAAGDAIYVGTANSSGTISSYNKGPVAAQQSSRLITTIFTNTSSQIKYNVDSASDAGSVQTYAYTNPHVSPQASE
ncbi:MAG: hypothetical protein KGL35_04360, partial [Bradyrhizobium sp.]|nr:hypothetical protein [Bradyrhizobium sp.]